MAAPSLTGLLTRAPAKAVAMPATTLRVYHMEEGRMGLECRDIVGCVWMTPPAKRKVLEEKMCEELWNYRAN